MRVHRVCFLSRNFLAISSLLLSLLVLSACSVTGSASVRNLKNQFVGCSSKLGSYALPRKVLKVKIVKASASGDFVMQTLDLKTVPDNAHVYCFEHTGNPFAEDAIRVFKNKITKKGATSGTNYVVSEGDETKSQTKEDITPFLQLVASKSVDHTAGIIRNFIQAFFMGISNNPNFDARAFLGRKDTVREIVADFQVDPFDYREMARVNHAIRRFGFCMILERYTYNVHEVSASNYCDVPFEQAQRHIPPAQQAIKKMRWHMPKPTSGIFYRPTAPYQLSVYVKHRPEDRGEWRLGLMQTFEMENIMPIVSVGIDRAVFAERRVGLIFDDGLLKNVCISKGSSVEGAIEIPLDIVYGIIALPSETIEATFEDAKTAKQLSEKRVELIQAQQNYIDFLKNGGSGVQGTVPEKAPGAVKLGLTPSGVDNFRDKIPSAGTILTNRNGSNALKDICEKLEAAGNVFNTANATGEPF